MNAFNERIHCPDNQKCNKKRGRKWTDIFHEKIGSQNNRDELYTFIMKELLHIHPHTFCQNQKWILIVSMVESNPLYTTIYREITYSSCKDARTVHFCHHIIPVGKCHNNDTDRPYRIPSCRNGANSSSSGSFSKIISLCVTGCLKVSL